ncbi:MAG: glutathione S-transferase family protein [Sphingomonas sp.]|jgi:glutathione S-transferase|uniref:glutathione S-transferase family protein n=1 Tax=Sphingomonas sp. TaxID=28214 RepID=UPI00356978C2
MSRFTVHGIPGSPYVRCVLITLEEKGLPYDLAAMAFGAHRAEAHRLLHPFQNIPVFEDDGFRLYETQAILRYIDHILPDPALTPESPQAEARMNQIIGITDCYVRSYISAAITFQRVVAPRLGLPVDEAKVAEALPKAETCIAELSQLIGDQPFMAGERLSLADLMLAPQLALFPDCAEGQDILGRYPGVTAWIDRMNARPSMIATTWDRLNERVAAQASVAA